MRLFKKTIPAQLMLESPILIPKTFFEDQLYGCLLLGAAGDAFGYVVEFLQTRQIVEKFKGPILFRELDQWSIDDAFIVSDDSQMTLFTAEGCDVACRGKSRNELPYVTSIVSECRETYLNWYKTQQRRVEIVEGETSLLRFRELYKAQAPGATCMTALMNGGDGLFNTTLRINESMGCGGVMRVAPLAFVPTTDLYQAFSLGCQSAALTHGHNMGIYPAGALVVILHHILAGKSIVDAVVETIDFLAGEPDRDIASQPLQKILRFALSFEGRQTIQPETIENALGGGWVGHECLAIAVAASILDAPLHHRMTVSANHSGDSDSTASIAGQLVGASLGYAGVMKEAPYFQTVIDGLDVKRVYEYMLPKFSETLASIR